MAKSVKNKKQNIPPPIPQAGDNFTSELPIKRTKKIALSGWPMIIGWLAMLIFTFHACTRMVAAGDTWVAMACGRHFSNHWVNTVEPFSANSHKAGPTEEEIETWPNWAQWITAQVGIDTVRACHPTGWINQNWLTHLIFYKLVPKSSYADGVSFTSNALVYWKFAIYIITVICVYYTSRLLGVNPALSAVFACFAMFIGRSFLDVRPAGFSNMLVAVFLLVLALTTYRHVLFIWLLVPVTVFWCNVHGGYIYIFIMLVPFVGLNLLTSISKKRFISIGRKGIYHTMAAGSVAFLATIVFNPFHLTNLTHTFVISVSKHAARWRDIHEWKSAFDWSNRVGTSFPFLVLYILGIGLLILWLFSRFLKPRFLNAPRNELEAQKKLYIKLSTVFGCAASVLVCWVTFVSFSLLGLDAVSFFWCAVFAAIILLSIYKNIHFIYLTVLLTLLAVWSGNKAVGYDGRHVYPFVILPVYVILHTLASLFSKQVKNKPVNVAFVILAAFVSLVLMTAIFNPFKFERSWNIGQFFDLQRTWHPVYERNLGLSYKNLFDVLFILNMVSIIFWLGFPCLREVFSRVPENANKEAEGETYQLPRIDLAIITIGALTIYMAIRSRRFIPIAGITACPIIAMFIDQIVCGISASRNFYAKNRLTVSPMPRGLQLFFTFAGVAAVVFFGTWWGLKFKRIYLDPWPNDPKYSSVFMRMTASDAKPFYATKFIRDNKLSGKMLNYWTEGGFIAWGQEPDPNTGRTPLQLFMDGRAQAAYDRRAFDMWSYVMSGGQITYDKILAARARGQDLTAADYREIGSWMDQQLARLNVWLVMMPSAVYNDPEQNNYYHATKGIEYDPNWPLVFYNNKQKIFVNVKTPRGEELFQGIFAGESIYPDNFHINLIRAHSWFMYYYKDPQRRKEGLKFAIDAFNEKPSPAPMFEIIRNGARFNELQPEINQFCADYVKRFQDNKENWFKQDGYRQRIEAARLASFHLEQDARRRKNAELINVYMTQQQECLNQLIRISEGMKW